MKQTVKAETYKTRSWFIQEDDRRIRDKLYRNREPLSLLKRQTSASIVANLQILNDGQFQHLQRLVNKFNCAFRSHSRIG